MSQNGTLTDLNGQVVQPDRWADDKAMMGQDPAQEVWAHYQGVIDGSIVSVPSPWAMFTRYTYCLMPGTITVVCGSPGCGKSLLALQWLAWLLKSGYGAAALELENDRKYHVRRHLVQTTGDENLLDLDWVKANPEKVEYYQTIHEETLNAVGNAITDSPRSMVNHEAVLKWMGEHSEYARVLFVDPITAVAQEDKPWIVDQKFITDAKRLAMDKKVSVVLVTHPKKGRVTAAPSMDDLAGGTAFQRFVDTVVWLRNDGEEEVNMTSPFGTTHGTINRRLLLCKTRDGKGSGLDVGMDFDKKSLTFRELGVIVEE